MGLKEFWENQKEKQERRREEQYIKGEERLKNLKQRRVEEQLRSTQATQIDSEKDQLRQAKREQFKHSTTGKIVSGVGNMVVKGLKYTAKPAKKAQKTRKKGKRKIVYVQTPRNADLIGFIPQPRQAPRPAERKAPTAQPSGWLSSGGMMPAGFLGTAKKSQKRPPAFNRGW